MGTALLAVLVVVAVLLFIYVVSGVRIVRPFQRGVKEMLGKYQETVDPGLRLIIPFVQSIRLVDMREQVVDVPPQEVITSDNVVVSVDAVVYYEPTDPQRLIYNVANFLLAVTKLAQTNLRNVIGEMPLDDALTSREKINVDLRLILDDATDKWGVRVVRVEIQRIDPPPDVMHSMHEQMKAERTRRAVVTEAEGRRSAAVTTAEGEKASAILRAEAVRQQQILQAQGQAEAARALADAERYRQLTVADGEAEAIREVYGAIHEGDPSADLIAIKYLEALARIADGQATKIFMPAELTGLAGSVSAVTELLKGAGDIEADGGPDARRARADRAAANRDERAARREADRAEIAAQSARRAEAQARVVAEAEALAPPVVQSAPPGMPPMDLEPSLPPVPPPGPV
ncbi:MAG TPA: SPFH domain-containing protein [Acidimicrobiales bacterium]|nr:SPFH domain-containing protein [Acidimicrobiales bacterium]